MSRARAAPVDVTQSPTSLRAGGRLDTFYFAFGDRDAYVVLDLPDNESAAAIALAVNAAGGATAKTTVLLTPDEVDAAAKRSVDYRAPGA